MVISVAIVNLLLARWAWLLDKATSGAAHMRIVWSILGLTWGFSATMFFGPRVGFSEIPQHIGWDLVSVTGSVVTVYWLLRLQIGVWGKKLDL